MKRVIVPYYTMLCFVYQFFAGFGKAADLSLKSRPKGTIRFRRGVGSPLSIAREHVIYKTPHDGDYVCDMSLTLI